MTDDLKESGEVRPALLLNDLVTNVYGGTLSNDDACPKYFRNADESAIYVTHENCAALENADNEKKCVTDLKEEAERKTPSAFFARFQRNHDEKKRDRCDVRRFNRDRTRCGIRHRVMSSYKNLHEDAEH